MNEKNIKRRRWLLWTALAVVVGLPAILAPGLLVLFHANAIRPDQFEPPADLVRPRASKGSAISTAQTSGTSGVLVPPGPHRRGSSTYIKLAGIFSSEEFKNGFSLASWQGGQPLSAEQIKWLTDHRELIADIVKLATTDGVPRITREQALALSRKELRQLQAPDSQMMLRFARILAAESSRRIDAGDANGAVETLLAARLLALSLREPFVLGHMVALRIQSHADQELARLLSRPSLTPDLARRIHDQLAGEPMAMTQLRDCMDLQYQLDRKAVIDLLNAPIADLFKYNINCEMKHFISLDPSVAVPGSSYKDIYWEFKAHPNATTGGLFNSAYRAITMKSSASRILDNYDSDYRNAFYAIDQNRPIDTQKESYLPTVMAFTNGAQEKANMTLHNLELVGLDMVAGGTGSETDPLTNEPFKTIQEDGSMLIYSIGPDLKDQHGHVAYDPTNGTTSAGDIMLRIPSR